MIESAKTIALKATLRSMQDQLGFIEEINDFEDNRLILIIRKDAFNNVGVEKVIVRILNLLLQHRFIKLIASSGSFGEIESSWVKKIESQSQRNDAIKSLFDSGTLTAVEYCQIYATTPFVHFGADDEKLYWRAFELWNKLTPLWKFLHENETKMPMSKLVEAANSPTFSPLLKDWEEFNKLDHERAETILKNLLQKMAELKQTTSVLVLVGNLPKYISEKAKAGFISYAIFNPAMATISDLEKYGNRLMYEIRLQEQDQNFRANDH